MNNILTLPLRLGQKQNNNNNNNNNNADIKPENIIFADNTCTQLKLCDFGMTKALDQLVDDFCGTKTYAAPEIWFRKHYDVHADMWSVGVLLYQVLMGIATDQVPTDLAKRIEKDPLYVKTTALQKMSDIKLTEVAQWCCNLDPSERPTPLEVVNFLTDESRDKLRVDSLVNAAQRGGSTPSSSKKIDSIFDNPNQQLYMMMKKNSSTSVDMNALNTPASPSKNVWIGSKAAKQFWQDNNFQEEADWLIFKEALSKYMNFTRLKKNEERGLKKLLCKREGTPLRRHHYSTLKTNQQCNCLPNE